MNIALFGIAAMLPIGSLALHQAPLPSEISLTSRSVAYYNLSKTMLTRLAERMPAEHYDFQPTPAMRTFAANVGHLASANVNQCGTLLGKPHPLSGQDLAKTLTTKAEAVTALADTFAFCDEYFTGLKDDAALTGEYFSTFVMRDGHKAPLRVAKGGIVTSFIAHNNEMYGYMAVYLRLKGIVPPSSEPSPARDVVDQAIAAMGGEARLTSLRGLSLESIGHAWALEQSERPEGPWLAIYYQRTDVRDYAGNRRSMQRQQRFWGSPNWSPAVPVVVAGGVAAIFNNQRWLPASAGAVQEWEDIAALAPERLLLTARAAPDLRSLGTEMKHGVQQDAIGFSWKGQPVKVWLNTWTHLPTGLELLRNDRFGIWGDVTERRWYSYWTLEAGGLMYPRQTTTEWNGLPSSDETVMSITVDAPIDDATFAIPDDTRAMFAERAKVPVGLGSVRLDETRVVPVTEWLLQLQGNFNVGVVRQPDGVVILEGTTSSAYSRQVLAFIERRFPNLPVKAVVTTSDAWPHLGGMREYAVRGTPVYPLDLNVAILQRLVDAPRTLAPEPEGRLRRPPVMRPVKARTTIGSGETRVELIPVRGEYGERMMLAWLPGAKVLYSSDLIQPDRTGTGFFMPAMLMEVAAAVEREGITDIDRVFGMHLPPTPWPRVVEAIAAAKAPARQP